MVLFMLAENTVFLRKRRTKLFIDLMSGYGEQ